MRSDLTVGKEREREKGRREEEKRGDQSVFGSSLSNLSLYTNLSDEKHVHTKNPNAYDKQQRYSGCRERRQEKRVTDRQRERQRETEREGK